MMRRVSDQPLAHVTQEGREHCLEEHLRGVSRLAGNFADKAGARGAAELAGLWHDLGKYAGNFQRMIREANGFEAHIEGDTDGPRDHSSAGAVHAIDVLGTHGLAIAMAIAGHHAGLADLDGVEHGRSFKDRYRSTRDRLEAAKRGGAPELVLNERRDCLVPKWMESGVLGSESKRRFEMWIRMVFSALVDADFLDTEAFFNPERADARGGFPSISTLAARLRAHVDGLQRGAPDTSVNAVRRAIRESCERAAERAPGIFSLTAPTGAGKTLASLAFGLAHAARHRLERVVVAIPFTSIVEQTASVYRTALQADAVVEHHSAVDPFRETPRNRVASENWDAPVVVTTSVQLLESLFANRPSRCRKLHRLCRSVIVLDEAQTLPPALLKAILDGLRALVRDYSATVVVATATQPALGAEAVDGGFEDVQEIVDGARRHFDALRRVRVRWPEPGAVTSYAALAGEVAAELRGLAIVHRRADARLLCEMLDRRLGHQETLHLSALMCPEHRTDALERLRARLAAPGELRVVATQLVEAGVDIDFPVVFRALAGIDALAQAAGRCNREGRLPVGELRVFGAETTPPPGLLRTALSVTETLLRQDPNLDLFDPDTYRAYFTRLYRGKDLDAQEIQQARAELSFASTAARFRIIDNAWASPVVVPYGRSARLIATLERSGPSRALLRTLQRYQVNVRKSLLDDWLRTGSARIVADTVPVLEPFERAAYDPRFGLVPERVGVPSPEELIA